MASSGELHYQPLSQNSEIRLVVLASGTGEEEISCNIVHTNLDADNESSRRIPVRRNPQAKSNAFSSNPATKHNHGMSSERPTTSDVLPLDVPSNAFRSYTAVSYVSGDQSNPKSIIVEHKIFLVGSNLHSLLRRLRSSGGSQTLWIDALCINKNDLAERAAQVKLMKRIYQQAETVIADLGDMACEDAEAVADLMYSIPQVGRQGEQKGNEEREDKVQQGGHLRFQKLFELIHPKGPLFGVKISGKPFSGLNGKGLPSENSGTWNSWRVLFSSPYWRRIWVLQEFALGKKVFLMLGKTCVPAEILENCIWYHFDYFNNRDSSFTRILPTVSDRDYHELTLGLYGCASMLRERYMIQNLGERTIECTRMIAKLAISGFFDATDPRDKIYAVLGIASDGVDFQSKVTYSDDVKKVLLSYARLFIDHGQGIEMLSQVSRFPADAALPSWVPDWSQSHKGGVCPLADRSIPDFRFAAAGSSIARMEVTRNLAELALRGAIFDTISKITTPLHSGKNQPYAPAHVSTSITAKDVARFIMRGIDLIEQTDDRYRSPDEKVEALTRTFFCGEPDLRLFEPDIQSLKTSCSDRSVSKPTVDNDHHSARSRLWAYLETRWGDSWGLRRFSTLFALGRSFCWTSRGYFGLVPGGAKPGDLLAVFSGGPMPFVLSPAATATASEGEDDGKGKFCLLGHGYVHELMHGEILKLKGYKEQEFILV